MSVINQALKDLEERQAYSGNEAIAGNVRVASRPSRIPGAWIFGVLVVVASAAAGTAGWLFSRAGAPTSIAAPVQAPKPVVVAAAPAPAAVPALVPAPAPAPVVQATAAVAPTPALAPAPKKAAPPPVRAAAPVKVVAEPGLLKSPAAPASAAAPVETASVEPRLEKSVAPQQQSENLYKQAVLLVQQGNGIDARPLLRRALQANPANGAARQLLAGLLVESNSLAEATILLREGTRLTPERSGLWMNLARLELEQGDTAGAMADLESGLPSAGADPAYHGFYAALLQRAQKHEDAVAHYVQALRGDPSMPSWLVGFAISLQALGRPADALAAFQRARDGGRLNASLQAFVDDRIEQLRR